MQINDFNELAKKLYLSVEDVNKNDAIKDSFTKIKNNPALYESEKENMYISLLKVKENTCE